MNFFLFAQARKYATTFLKIAYPVPGTAPIDEYEKLSSFFRKNPGLIGLICTYPCRENCTNLLENFFASKFNLLAAEKKLIKQLILTHKINILPALLVELIAVEHERLNEIPCKVELSHNVSIESFNSLKKYFESKFNAKLIPSLVINSELICGLKIYSRTKLYDYSIKKVLDGLSRSIRETEGT
ncbi:F0F1 ATP synthase subunit delta [Candidatus Dependentiae bacterium]|nr:F0F1 ATP synthase subunit delta [Candidatus Dependentiae bacterium]